MMQMGDGILGQNLGYNSYPKRWRLRQSAYNTMSLGQNLGIKPYALKMEDLILITIIKLPYLHQI